MPAQASRMPIWRRRLGWWKLRVRRALAVGMVQCYAVAARRRAVRVGVTVVTVNYNSLPQLRVLLEAVDRYTNRHVDIVVVDNGSTDGSREFLRAHPTVRALLLPVNIGHGPALDLAMFAATTTIVVAFDVDAFPISSDWLPSVVERLENGSAIVGAHLHRAYVHPCFLGMRRSDFTHYRLSFVPVGHPSLSPRRPAPLFLDVGEALSHALSQVYGSFAVDKIAPTSIRGPGMIGTVFGELVYHNLYTTHGVGDAHTEGAAAWQEAVERYLGRT